MCGEVGEVGVVPGDAWGSDEHGKRRSKMIEHERNKAQRWRCTVKGRFITHRKKRFASLGSLGRERRPGVVGSCIVTSRFTSHIYMVL
jgi:hypothetical protein